MHDVCYAAHNVHYVKCITCSLDHPYPLMTQYEIKQCDSSETKDTHVGYLM